MILRKPLKKIVVCLIACIHSIFLYDGIYTTLKDNNNFARNEDLEYKEKVEAIFLYGLHFVLIFLLIYSVVKNSPKLIVPWLVVTFPVFTYMTFMVLRGLKDMRWYLIDKLVANLCYVGVCWTFWSVLYLIVRTGDLYLNADYKKTFYIRFLKRYIE